MRIIAIGTLRAFWQQPAYRTAEQPLKAWVAVVRAAAWGNPVEAKEMFNSADVLRSGRIIFDISGNRYRIVAHINYRRQIVYIRFIGTHAQYDAIDPQIV